MLIQHTYTKQKTHTFWFTHTPRVVFSASALLFRFGRKSLRFIRVFAVNLPSIDQIYIHSHTNKSSRLSAHQNFIAFYFILTMCGGAWFLFPYINMLKKKKTISLLNVHVRVSKGDMHTHYYFYIEPYTAVSSFWVLFLCWYSQLQALAQTLEIKKKISFVDSMHRLWQNIWVFAISVSLSRCGFLSWFGLAWPGLSSLLV